MASMKDIKNRIKTIESTMQITKAMELVATSKLRLAKKTMEKAAPYFDALDAAMLSIERDFTEPNNIFFKSSEGKNRLFIVVGGDRGLAGGFNQNVFKKVLASAEENNAMIFPIGKKVKEFFVRRNFEVLENSYEVASDIHIGDCFDIGKRITEGFLNGEFDSVEIFYTRFNNMITQTPESAHLLPLIRQDKDREKGCLTIYEPSAENAMENIVPMYISGMVFGAVSQSQASEQAARRTAMNSANKNAGEMIDDLSIKYNRARQAAITQEITEIVAGSKNGD